MGYSLSPSAEQERLPFRHWHLSMGSKNLERWSAEDWRATAETVRKMDADGWKVQSVCIAWD